MTQKDPTQLRKYCVSFKTFSPGKIRVNVSRSNMQDKNGKFNNMYFTATVEKNMNLNYDLLERNINTGQVAT